MKWLVLSDENPPVERPEMTSAQTKAGHQRFSQVILERPPGERGSSFGFVS